MAAAVSICARMVLRAKAASPVSMASTISRWRSTLILLTPCRIPLPSGLPRVQEFESTSKWDPSTPVMDKLTPGPVAVGHRYHAESEFRGKRQTLEYEVIELTENHIRLRGKTRPSQPSTPLT